MCSILLGSGRLSVRVGGSMDMGVGVGSHSNVNASLGRVLSLTLGTE